MSARFVTARELAAELEVSTGALLRWTRAGKVPAVKLPSGAVRYERSAIDAWLDECGTGAAERGVSPARSDRAHRGVSSVASPVTPLSAAPNEEEHDGRT